MAVPTADRISVVADMNRTTTDGAGLKLLQTGLVRAKQSGDELRPFLWVKAAKLLRQFSAVDITSLQCVNQSGDAAR